MNQNSRSSGSGQRGALGVFMCVALVIVFGLISLQNITSTSVDLYLSNSKQHIEEARQLAYAGLRHYTHNYGNDQAIKELIDTYRSDTDVIGRCSFTDALPDTLVPVKLLAKPTMPNPNQDIEIRGVIVPYDCNRGITDNNYRATFQIVASVNCTSTSGVSSGCVKRSFVFNREDDKDGEMVYRPIRTENPPSRPPGSRTNSGNDNDDDDSGSSSSSNKKQSKGRQEVGF